VSLLTKKASKHEKTVAELPKQRKISNMERFSRAQNLLTGLKNHCFKRQNDIKLVVTGKNDEPMPQPEIDRNSGW